MFCQWFNPLEHLSASSSNSEVNSHPVHGLIYEGTYTLTLTLSNGLIHEGTCYKTQSVVNMWKIFHVCWHNPVTCQWFNPLEHLSATSEVNSHPVHGLIHEGTCYKLSRSLICRKLFT